MNTSSRDVRGVLIQTEAAQLLLPNATVSEVLSYATPEAVEDAPDWLLGRIRWRGWRLPLLAFAPLADLGEEQGGLGSKVVVLKTFGGHADLPYFALLTKGFPRLVTVSPDRVVRDDDGELPRGVKLRVSFNGEAAFIPDIDQVEGAIRESLAA